MLVVVKILFLALALLPYAAFGIETFACFHYNFGYEDSVGNSTSAGLAANSSAECQVRCAATAGCKGFTFWENAKRCDVSLTAAMLKPATGDVGVAGPPTCTGDQQACTAVPGAAFPGVTATDSAAAWPGGVVPTNAQCWPRDPATGSPVLCNPQNITILEDTATGWPGKCLGLSQQDGSQMGNQTCQEYCLGNPLCSVWSEVNISGQPPQCWQGVLGQQCYSETGPTPTRSQRVMHGTYRVLKNLKGIQVMGLTNVFSASQFKDANIAPAHCRFYCIASLACQYWQYSTVSGCWVEELGAVQYPLTDTPGASNQNTPEALAIIDGEYIQHLCGPPQAMTTAAPLISNTTTIAVVQTVSSPPLLVGVGVGSEPNSTDTATNSSGISGFPWYAWLLGILGIILCGAIVGGAIIFLKRKPKKGRGIQQDMSEYPPYNSSVGPYDSEAAPLTGQQYDVPQYETQLPDASPSVKLTAPQLQASPYQSPQPTYSVAAAPTTYSVPPVQLTAQPYQPYPQQYQQSQGLAQVRPGAY